MIRSFEVKNFRCFRQLKVENVERVNLIAGKNNVGKTAFLEALFLLLGPDNPELPMRLNVLRGIQWFEFVPEEAWGWIFTDRNTQEVIELSSRGDGGGRRHLRIRLAEPQGSPLSGVGNGKNTPAKSLGSTTTAAGVRELVLEYQDGSSAPTISRASIVLEGEQPKVRFQRGGGENLPLLERPAMSRFPLGIFLTSAVQYQAENPQRFSRLQEIGRENEIIAPLRILEPRLRRLVVSAWGPGFPVIQGDVGVRRLVPIELMGGGIGKLLSCLLAIAEAQHGTVLLDEIENGLHHSVLPKVWAAIAEFAGTFDTQVFATTHSLECIHAAHEAFSAGDKYDFALHRLDRVEDEIRAVTYDREMLDAAIKADMEIR